MGIDPSFVVHMPIGELSEIIDCNLILNGYCDESVHNPNDYEGYVNIDLE